MASGGSPSACEPVVIKLMGGAAACDCGALMGGAAACDCGAACVSASRRSALPGARWLRAD